MLIPYLCKFHQDLYYESVVAVVPLCSYLVRLFHRETQILLSFSTIFQVQAPGTEKSS